MRAHTVGRVVPECAVDYFRDRIICDILVAVTGAETAYWRQRTEYIADFYEIYPRFKSTVISVSGENKAMGQYIRDFGLLLGMTGKAKAGAVRCDRTIKIQPSVCSQFGGHRGGYAFGQIGRASCRERVCQCV